MKALFRSIMVLYGGLLLAGCESLSGGKISGGHNPATGEISGMVEITFRDAKGNAVVRRYPRSHPAVQHLLANP